MLFQLIYTSTSISEMSRERLADLMIGARERNIALGVTGMLVYQRRTFIQFLEGPRAEVERLFYDRIRRDERHAAIIVFYEGLAEKRTFSEWSMACYQFADDEAPPGGYGSLDEALQKSALADSHSSEAVDLLLAIHESGRRQVA